MKMDISRVYKNEDLRQWLISVQKSDGTYNPDTGAYKWGEIVYDLTKTDGEIGLGWMPMRGKIIEYGK